MADKIPQNVRLRLLSYFVIFYLVMACGWWTILLFTKNRDAYLAKLEVMRMGMYAEEIIRSETEFQETIPFQQLSKEYKRQEWMIVGEAMVFVISLIIGIWLINRGYRKEVLSANQRRNFLLSITHELKSPIASIRLVLETILKRKLTEQQQSKLGQNALKETDRLNALVNDLLLSAKLETTYDPVFEEFVLNELIQDIIVRMRSRHQNRIFNYLSPKVLMTGDKSGLTSVFTNLIENAVKYSPSGSAIDVTTSQKHEIITIEIADQGFGIPEKEKQLVFQKFYRVGNEDTRRTKGTGLGLYIVKEIIKAHNGKIDITDNRPKGSIFKITLPINKEADV